VIYSRHFTTTISGDAVTSAPQPLLAGGGGGGGGNATISHTATTIYLHYGDGLRGDDDLTANGVSRTIR
jgi:hypothetical protein